MADTSEVVDLERHDDEPPLEGDGQVVPSTPKHSRVPRLVVGGAVLGVALVGASIFGVARDDAAQQQAATSPTSVPAAQGRGSAVQGEPVPRFEARVAAQPNDYVAWATLGVAYVDEARTTGNTSRYVDADKALARSLEIKGTDNFTADLGLAAVAAARHDFASAETHARRGLQVNPSNASLYGVLSDALIQQGKYDEGFAAVQRMVDLSPDSGSLSRVAYTHELKGDNTRAREVWRRVRDESATPGDRASALFQLGELDISEGNPASALGFFNEALTLKPDHAKALSGKAHALRLSGQTLTSIDTYKRLMEVAPLADFMLEFGDFLAETGRNAEANELYARAAQVIEKDRGNGMKNDAGLIFYELDHGDPAKALTMATEGVAQAPFIEMHEAHAWALYKNGRPTEAVAAIDAALALGTRDAELHLNAAVIRDAAGDHAGALAETRTALAIDRLVSIGEAENLLAEVNGPT